MKDLGIDCTCPTVWELSDIVSPDKCWDWSQPIEGYMPVKEVHAQGKRKRTRPDKEQEASGPVKKPKSKAEYEIKIYTISVVYPPPANPPPPPPKKSS